MRSFSIEDIAGERLVQSQPPTETEAKTDDEHNESDDLASRSGDESDSGSGSGSGSSSSSSSNESIDSSDTNNEMEVSDEEKASKEGEKATSDGEDMDTTDVLLAETKEKASSCGDEKKPANLETDTEEKVPSGDGKMKSEKASKDKILSSDWSKEPVAGSVAKEAETVPNQTSQNGSNQTADPPVPPGGQDDQVMVDNGFGGFSIQQLTVTGEVDNPAVLASFKTSMYWLNRQLGKRDNLH